MAGAAAAGELSAFSYALETTPGVYTTPNKWLYAQSGSGFVSKPDAIEKDVHSGTVTASRIKRLAKFQTTGNFTYNLMPTHGAPILKAVFGADAGLTALTADTVKAATPVVTASGISTITLTNTAAATYVQGAWININTGTSCEARPILTVATNGAPGTILTVPALVKNASAAAGTAVSQVGQIKCTTNNTSGVLPTLSFEQSEGMQFSWQVAGGYVDKFEAKAGKDEVLATLGMFSTQVPVKLGSPTTPAASAAEIADLTYPFTITDTIIAGYQDPLQSGGVTATSTQQSLTYITDVTFTYTNNIIKFPTHDTTQNYRAARGKNDLTIQYTYVNVSGRAAEFEDYLTAAANLTVPFFFGAANNQSSTSTAAMRAWGAYVPALKLMDYTPARQIGNVLMSTVTAKAVPATAGGDLCTVFVQNADGAAAY